MIPRAFGRRLVTPLVLVLAAAAASCRGVSIDLVQALQVTDVTTGWYDVGLVEGNKNKIVPTISFRLKNASSEAIPSGVMINAVFRRVGEDAEWDAVLIRATHAGGLAVGAWTDPFVLRTQQGYTGEEPRAQMLVNSQFIDAHAEIFAKYGAAQYRKLGDYPIKRLLLTR